MTAPITKILKLLLKKTFLSNHYFAVHQYFISKLSGLHSINRRIRYRNSILLDVNLGDWIQQQVYFLGDYEREEIDYLCQNLRPGNTFIDIGANIGLYTLNAAEIVGENGKVFAFEAFPANFDKLQHHLKLNNFMNVTAENLAISSERCFLEIYYDKQFNNSGMASAYLKNTSLKQEVQATSLDEYVQEKKISAIHFIKIDIEGGEYNAVVGMQNVLKRFKPTLLVEVNPETLAKSGKGEGDLIDLLSSLHYDKKIVLSRNESSYNAIFLPG
ncbi:FkbM family methyltransferase [uncultured Chryseobacterium sp.]|uniref:FkbM family methyltransferase n=1 Tax=uncultured Chryseobacterium sp. TaxID=259322 RepID=UPI0026344DCB|nr:FkbM family methyltransferase [uncultured Chryseobacterium sp.]